MEGFTAKADCIFVFSVLQIWIPYHSEVARFYRLLRVECVVYSYQWSMTGINSSMRMGRMCLRIHQWGKTTLHFKLETIPASAMRVSKMIISDRREGEVRKKWEVEEPRKLEEWRGWSQPRKRLGELDKAGRLFNGAGGSLNGDWEQNTKGGSIDGMWQYMLLQALWLSSFSKPFVASKRFLTILEALSISVTF